MKTRAEKHEEVKVLHETLLNTPHLFVSGFEKLTVQQDFELRKTVREAGGTYKVVKNALVEKAAAGTPAEPMLSGLAGMSSIAYTAADPVALAKALTTYAKTNPTLTFKAGMVEGRVIDAGSIEALASMPSREEVLARLLYVIQAPAQRLVTAISGVGRNLAVVIDQGVKENKFGS
jgi:large subunit ribosomal protein L10